MSMPSQLSGINGIFFNVRSMSSSDFDFFVLSVVSGLFRSAVAGFLLADGLHSELDICTPSFMMDTRCAHLGQGVLRFWANENASRVVNASIVTFFFSFFLPLVDRGPVHFCSCIL